MSSPFRDKAKLFLLDVIGETHEMPEHEMHVAELTGLLRGVAHEEREAMYRHLIDRRARQEK